MCKIKNWPKRLDGEKPREYAERMGIDHEDFKAIRSDPVTGELLFPGYGWYDPYSEEFDES